MSKTRQSKIRSLAARFSPGHVVAWHSHQWHQLLYATSGVFRLKTKNTRWVVPSHRAIWIPSGLAHEVEMAGSVMMQTLYFKRSMRVLLADKCIAVNVSNLMRELIIHICEQGILAPDSIENRCLIQFVVFQAKKMESEPLMLPMPVDGRAVAAADFILENPSENLSEVAKQNSTSLRTLQRIFTAETGMSLGRWRSQARLLSALPLLARGRQVTDVSMDLGFESLSAFISAFRKFFGITPAKYFRPSSLP